MRAQSLNHAQLFATPWTVTCQDPLSMGFSRQEYWSGLPFPSPGRSLYKDMTMIKVSPKSIDMRGKRDTYFPLFRFLTLWLIQFIITSFMTDNLLFSRLEISGFCFFHFLFKAFSWSSQWTNALFFDLCISWRRIYIEEKNIWKNVSGTKNLYSWSKFSPTPKFSKMIF